MPPALAPGRLWFRRCLHCGHVDEGSLLGTRALVDDLWNCPVCGAADWEPQEAELPDDDGPAGTRAARPPGWWLPLFMAGSVRSTAHSSCPGPRGGRR